MTLNRYDRPRSGSGVSTPEAAFRGVLIPSLSRWLKSGLPGHSLDLGDDFFGLAGQFANLRLGKLHLAEVKREGVSQLSERQNGMRRGRGRLRCSGSQRRIAVDQPREA